MFFTITAVITLVAAVGLLGYSFKKIESMGLLAPVLGAILAGLVGYLGLCGLGAIELTMFSKVVGWGILVLGGLATVQAVIYGVGLSFVFHGFAGNNSNTLGFDAVMLGIILGLASIVLTAVKVLFLT
jgi:hypothetical protein